MKILGIIVVFDEARSAIAVKAFSDVLSLCANKNTMRVVSNNPDLDFNDIRGSNNNAEFSGWDEGFSSLDLNNYDAIILANDTFCIRRKFGENEINLLKQTIHTCSLKSSPYIAGELAWAINYNELLHFRKFLIRWIRTSLFVVSPSALNKLISISISDIDSKKYIELKNGNFDFDECVPRLFRLRINSWLFPGLSEAGWYRSHGASAEHLLIKAKCVLQELFLVYRCELSNIRVVGFDSKFSMRQMLFRLLYYFQKFTRI